MSIVLLTLTLLVSCGGSDADSGPSDPFEGTFQEGIYTRNEDGKNYEIRFGVALGRYILLVDGAETRRGTHTLVTTAEGEPALAFIDEGDFAGKCPDDQALGVYPYEFKDNKLSLRAWEENCDARKDQLESKDWVFQGFLATPTP